MRDELLAALSPDRQVGGGQEGDWPEPALFDAPSKLPPFPQEALPRTIGDFCSAVAESRQVPRDLPAMVALGVASAAAARRFYVRVTGNYWEPLNIFTATFLEPGERKSAIFRDMTAPLVEAQRELQEREAPRIAAARERRELEDARLEHLRRQAAKADDPAEITALAVELAQNLTRVPASPRLIVGDVTAEKLASMLADQGGRLALADAEAGGIFEIMGGRYGNGRPNFDVYLKGHAGDDHLVDRMDRTEVVRYPALTVILTPQPAILRALATEPLFRGRGLLARFLYSLPQSRVGSRVFVNSAVHPRASAAYVQTIRRILAVDAPEGDEHGHPMSISPAALQVWTRFYDEMEARQQDGRDLRSIRDWASKASGAALRVAGLLHLTEGYRQDVPIREETMAAAWAIVRDYLVPHALEAFTMMARDLNVEQARKIANWIFREQRDRLTIRDAHRNFPSFGEPADFKPPFRVLENRSIIRAAPEEPRSGPGRKPSPAYFVNPGFLKLSAQLTESEVAENFVDSVNTSGVPVP